MIDSTHSGKFTIVDYKNLNVCLNREIMKDFDWCACCHRIYPIQSTDMLVIFGSFLFLRILRHISFFLTRRTVTFIVPVNNERRNESASIMLSQRMIIRFAHLLPLKGLMLDSLNEPYLRCNFSSTTCISHQIWLIFLLPRFIHSIRQNYSGWV